MNARQRDDGRTAPATAGFPERRTPERSDLIRHSPVVPSLALEMPAALVEAVAQRAAQLVADRIAEQDTDRWMNVDDAAAYLACGPRRIYDLHSQRRLLAHKDGSRLLFRRSDLDAYVEAGS